MKKVLFIYNPKAGTGLIRSNLSYILEEMIKKEYEITIHPTRTAEDARETTSTMGALYDMIICSGGDGTLDQVVEGMQKGGFRRQLGYIPAGSTNDFAASLGLSRDMRRAARDIVEGTEFDCDIGRLNDDYFIYVAAFGAFTDVAYKTSQEWKNALGHLAYILEGVKSLSNLKSWKMSFVSEEYSGEGEFLYGMVTNSNSVGGFKGITGQDVTLNDGKFEVTLIRNTDNIIIWAGIINALLTGEENEYVISFKTSHLEVFSETPIPWTRDGEYGGSHTHAVIDNIPGALPMIVPQHVAAYENGEDVGYFEEAGEEDDDAEEILRE